MPIVHKRNDPSAQPSIAIVGASGLIGYRLYRRLKKSNKVLGTYCLKAYEGLVPLDLCQRKFSILDACNIVILAAAESNIDRCMTCWQKAYAINVEGTVALAEYLADRQIRILFLSSDQVFDGSEGKYSEEDTPNPINEYGRMKRRVEQRLGEIQPSSLVLRLSKTYSTSLMEGGMMADVVNALRQEKPYDAAYNQIFNPTDVEWVSEQIEKIIRMNLSGLYHLAEPRIESRYDFACRIAHEYGLNPALIRRINLAELKCVQPRALNSSLNVSRIMKVLHERVN